MNGYEIKNATPTYTGGGIYVINGKLENGWFFMSCPSDGFTEILNADGSEKNEYGDEVMYDTNWIEEHRVATLSDGEMNDEFMVDLCKWIIAHKPNGNYDMHDIEVLRWEYHHNIDDEDEEKKPEYTETEINIGGPVDALLSYFINKAYVEQYEGRDANDIPVNASYMCNALGKLSERAWKANDNEEEFYLIVKNEDGVIWWEVEDEMKIDEKTEEVYHIVIDGDPFLYKVNIPREVTELNYCKETDRTFVMKHKYIGDEIVSSEVTTWYYGEPDGIKGYGLKATY